MTESERQFQKFCLTNSIEHEFLIPDHQKTPDFRINTGGTNVFVEIKELTANADQARAAHDVEARGFAIWGNQNRRTFGARLRDKISASTEQLERFASQTTPTMLVLYDARPEPVRGIYPDEIKVAMYGNERIALEDTADSNQPVTFGAHHFANNGKLTPTNRVHISAIAVLRGAASAGTLYLDIYHNEHATTPLPRDSFARCAYTTEFRLANGNGFREWVRVYTEATIKAAPE